MRVRLGAVTEGLQRHCEGLGGCSDYLGCRAPTRLGGPGDCARRGCSDRLGAAATVRALGTCSDGEGTWGLQRLACAVAASASSRRRRRRRVVVVASSSFRGWQHLAGNIWCGWVATIARQHLARLGGNNCVATFSAAGWQQLGGNI